jgi:hypothetical protein
MRSYFSGSPSMLNAIIVATALSVAGYLTLSKRAAGSLDWKATVTPLASIMGSGFLVSAPLLAGAVGNLAVVCMAGLLVLAYAIGDAIRFNIAHFEPIENEIGVPQRIAFMSRIVLACAYFISVTYYLQLLAAFVLSSFGHSDPMAANVITTALLSTIGVIGIVRGLDRLEAVEKYAISLNLGAIAALLIALAIHNLQLVAAGDWALPVLETHIGVADIRVLLGLLIVVQGFETSRYLGSEHPAEQRIRTMRSAQRLSAGIYIVFLSLVTVLFHDKLGTDVTAIIAMTRPVAAVLPILLAVAAIGSQFSASVADNAGAGGLIEEITHHRLPARYGYALILAVTIALTWETDVNTIIAYASRSFALYYALQCAVALTVARRMPDLEHRGPRMFGFGALVVFCLVVFAFGLPAG